MPLDPLSLLQELIACPSVTPADGGAQSVLTRALENIGFTVHRFVDGAPPDGPVHNLLAIRERGGTHLAFAGHTDVVPAGNGWTGDPFAARIEAGRLVGRGAVDMKGAIAAFVAAAAQAPETATLSFIITGDEEGPATHGTTALMRWMDGQRIHPDFILVGEPTSVATLGDTIKIGRRGSVNIWIKAPGTQGHVAYPHLGDNPVPRLAKVIARLAALELDSGTDWFQPSNLEITDLHVGNSAHNLIPGAAEARLNIRFNDLHRGEDLIGLVQAEAEAECPGARVRGVVSGEAFLTPPGALSAMVCDAVKDVVGRTPELSTSGGTSDARFLSPIAPVVELGLVNATMHKVDEAVAIEDLYALRDIYAAIIRRVCA